MGYKLVRPVAVSELCTELGLAFEGDDRSITGVAPFDDHSAFDLTFSKDTIGACDGAIVIGPIEVDGSARSPSVTYIASARQRLDFIRSLSYLQRVSKFATYDHDSQIHPSVSRGQNVVVERGCVIGENVVLEHNVVIHSGTRIGKNSRIKSGSSIGGDGFGFERDEVGKLLRFDHLGGVVIGENVEIGALSTISCGTLSDTVICNGVKSDNLVYIAHNCFIDEGALLTGGVMLGGGAKVGRNAWLGPNASVMQKAEIGDGAVIGLGAVVTKNAEANFIYAGCPAKKIRRV